MYPAINIYALASGYVLVEKKISRKGIIKHYAEVWFYSVFITILTQLITHTFSIKYIIKSVIPVTSGYYWYFTAYFGMYLLLPYINGFLQKLEKRSFEKFLIIVLCMFSVMPTLKHGNVFGELNGYGIIWITVMYIVGAYIKLHFSDYIEKHRGRIIIGVVACLAVNIGSHFVLSKIQALSAVSEYLISYNSVTMVIYSVLLFGLLVNIKRDNNKNRKLLLISQATFGIYLIHSNPMMTEHYWNNKIWEIIVVNNGYSIARSFIALIVIYFVCMIISLVRNYIDKRIGISKWITDQYSGIEGKVLRRLKISNINN